MYSRPSIALMPVLSLTLLISWGSLYYAFAALARPIQLELHCSAAQTMGAYSVALVVWGICTQLIGRTLDRRRSRHAMTIGSCLSAALFAALSQTQSAWALYLVWAGLGAAMSLTLYEPAFAAVVAAYPQSYRKRIGILTVAGGFASTVFWPLTHLLVAQFGWRGAVLVFAAMHLAVCAPLHWCLLPGRRRSGQLLPPVRAGAPSALQSGIRGYLRNAAFWQMSLCFVAFSFVTSAMSMHLIPILQSRGVESTAAIAMAALVGPMQAGGRLTELLLGDRASPLALGAFTVLLMPLALLALIDASGGRSLCYVFIAAYGVGHGLFTIVRATIPIELFGDEGYASVSGALGGPALIARAGGPLATTSMSSAAWHYDGALLAMLAAAVIGAAAYLMAVRPRPA